MKPAPSMVSNVVEFAEVRAALETNKQTELDLCLRKLEISQRMVWRRKMIAKLEENQIADETEFDRLDREIELRRALSASVERGR